MKVNRQTLDLVPTFAYRFLPNDRTRKQPTWMYYARLVEVQPLTPPKSKSGRLATIFKLTHSRAAQSRRRVYPILEW